MRNKIKYIGFYSEAGIEPQRYISLAGKNKMDYTIKSLNDIGLSVDIISPACIVRNEKGCKFRQYNIGKNNILYLFSMFGNRNKMFAILNLIFLKIKLFLFLIKNTETNEPVLVYHSLVIANVIRLAKKIKRFKLILELNEIYTDVQVKSNSEIKKEYKIISIADAFMFPNDLMNGMFNNGDKPHIVEYGIYQTSEKLSSKFSDGKIHVVYAGTFDENKGGAIYAIEAAKHLTSNYHVHILGFGNEKEISRIEKMINAINKISDCTLTYDGKLDGSQFIEFIQQCHIGLSTQNPVGKYNDTSFPSKILTYLSNGLQVVSIDIPAVSKSKLSGCINFYKNQNSKEIANAILGVKDFTTHDNLLMKLDLELKTHLKQLLKTISI